MADWSKILSRGRVEDRRGLAPTIGGLGLGGAVLFMIINYALTGTININDALNTLQQVQVQPAGLNAAEFQGEDQYEVFVSAVLGSVNDMWEQAFASQGETYVEPQLVLFRSGTQSGCGVADSRVGPHYCPLDQTIYIDETFFDELRKLGGSGDVAEAYVIAHEVGHHVQNMLGVLDAEQTQEDAIAVELQADCFAGLWAYSIRDLGVFEANEIHEAIDAAAAVGDDRIQSTYQGRINPETWTHGSSQERVAAFTKGYDTGSVAACSI